MFSDYPRHDALGLAELVRTRQVTPAELVDEALARIDRGNPVINAVIHRLDERARAAAAAPLADPSAPFAGVPFLAKDLLSTWQGERQGNGSRLMDGYVAPADSELTRRYKRAGIVLVGKTNTPECGLIPVTEPRSAGITRNPWDPTRTPGGSSGGSGAAVAAGFVPMAGGGDGGGSIRIPAACNGLFGLKPTRARTPIGPVIGEAWLGCAVEHVLTRSVRDSAAMLDAIHGADPGAPYAAPAPARPFLAEVGAAPGKLRIALTTRPLLPADPVHPDGVEAVTATATLLRELGHEVVEDHPTFDAAQFAVDFIYMLVAETAADVRAMEAVVGRRARRGDLEPQTAVLARLGNAVSAVDYAAAARRIRTVGRALAPFFATYDLLLTPTLAQLPLEIGALTPRGADKFFLDAALNLPLGKLLLRAGALQKIAAKSWNFTPFTAVFNASGQPACSVPMHWNAAGLPVGIQLVGRFGDEATLLRVASQLEQARPWKERRPPGFV
jgi:amidase